MYRTSSHLELVPRICQARDWGTKGPACTVLHLIIIALVAFPLGGCDLFTGTDSSQRILAYIQTPNNLPEIVLPDTVEKGEDFTVSIATYSPVACAEHGGTGVESSGSTVRISPFLLTPAQTTDQNCATQFKSFTHEASVLVEVTGTAKILVRGNGGSVGEEVSYERHVVVE